MAQNHVGDINLIMINNYITYPKLSQEVLFNVIHMCYLWNGGGWLRVMLDVISMSFLCPFKNNVIF
jgi:hypothetical protein